MNSLGSDAAEVDHEGVVVDPEDSALPPLRATRTVFVDPEQEAAYRSLGYVVVDDVPDVILEALDALVADGLPGGVEGFHSTLLSGDASYRGEVAAAAPSIVEPLARRVLDDYLPFAASLTVKGVGEGSELASHQDWTMVDEDHFRGINIWIPLVDTDLDNGALRVLPRSHRALDHLRCSPCNPAAFVSHENEVPLDELELLPLRRGQAVVFDQGVLHGSGPNRSSSARPAVTVAYAPAEAPLLHLHVVDPTSGMIDVYEADRSFFVSLAIGEAPDREPIGTRRMSGRAWRADDLVSACRPGGGLPPERTFLDDELQARFDSDGYVVVDLLSPEQVATLQALVEDVFEGGPEGFHATNMLPSVGYRRSVWNAIRPMLEPIAAPLFDDHEACTAALMIKFPGDDSGFITHQDWSLVDETRFRSVNVWCPLVETGAENGGLRMLPGSHRLLGAVRPSPAPPSSYQHPGWAVDHSSLRLLEVAAGQAVIFDHSILHGSEPNRGAEPRPAVTIAFKPRRAELLHWFVPDLDDDRVERYVVDPEYLTDFVLGQAPAYPLAGVEVFARDSMTTAELIRFAEGDGERQPGSAAEEVDGACLPPVERAVPPAVTSAPGSGPRRLLTRVVRKLRQRTA